MNIAETKLLKTGEFVILINILNLNVAEEIRYDDGCVVLDKFTDDVGKVLNESKMFMKSDHNEFGVVNFEETGNIVDGFDGTQEFL